MFFVFFIIIVFCFAFCYVSAPTYAPLIIKRNGTIYKTLRPGQSTFINPFTDSFEIPRTSAVAFNTPNSTRGGLTNNFKLNVPIYSLDRKSATIYISGSYTLTKSLPSITVNDLISKIVRAYYSKVIFSTSPLELNKNELNILDLLREKLSPSGIKINSFTLSLKDSTNFEKVDCVHYDEDDAITKPRKKHSSNFDYYETNKGAIKDFSIEVSDDPIRETYSITSSVHNTLDNMDSNVDPIDNKF